MELVTRKTFPGHQQGTYFATAFPDNWDRIVQASHPVLKAGEQPFALGLSIALFQSPFPLVSHSPLPAPHFHCHLLLAIINPCLWSSLSSHLPSQQLLACSPQCFLLSSLQSSPTRPLVLLFFFYLLSFHINTQDAPPLHCLKSHLAMKTWKRDSSQVPTHPRLSASGATAEKSLLSEEGSLRQHPRLSCACRLEKDLGRAGMKATEAQHWENLADRLL